MAGQAYDDRDGVIWMDGEFLEWREAKVHVLTHALHYASSVFDAERAYDGKIFKSHEHSERLIASARHEVVGLVTPPDRPRDRDRAVAMSRAPRQRFSEAWSGLVARPGVLRLLMMIGLGTFGFGMAEG